MIIEIDRFERHVTGIIKVGKYKSVKTIEELFAGTLFTKLMTFDVDEDIMWVQQELQNRMKTL